MNAAASVRVIWVDTARITSLDCPSNAINKITVAAMFVEFLCSGLEVNQESSNGRAT